MRRPHSPSTVTKIIEVAVANPQNFTASGTYANVYGENLVIFHADIDFHGLVSQQCVVNVWLVKGKGYDDVLKRCDFIFATEPVPFPQSPEYVAKTIKFEGQLTPMRLITLLEG